MTSKTKDNRLLRTSVPRMLSELERRIRFLNCDREWPYCITRAVVFGSYVNSDKPRISDLDIGIEISRRYKRDFGPVIECAYDKLTDEHPSYGRMLFMEEAVLRATFIRLRRHSSYISLHRIGYDDEAIFSDKVRELTVGPIHSMEGFE